MKKRRSTESKVYELIGRLIVKLVQVTIVGAIFAGFALAALNNITVYR